MTATFTPEEVSTLIKAVTMSGMAVAIADVGLVSTAIEAAAMAKEVTGASQKYPNNSLIQAAFSESGIKQATPTESPKDITPENAADKAVAAISDAMTLLQSKEVTQELGDYKQLIYDVAERVANAAGEGLFGSGAQKISAKEAATLAKIKTALSI